MAQPGTTNTHLHKVLTHRNYMHHVSLQKQLNVYDRQKKLVEKELQEITKVREAIQQINKTLSKKSPTISKRGSTPSDVPKKSKSTPCSQTKSGNIVKEREKELVQQDDEEDEIPYGQKQPSSNANEIKIFASKDESHRSRSTQSLQTKNEEHASRRVSPKKELGGSTIESLTQPNNLKSNTASTDNHIREQLSPTHSKHVDHPLNTDQRKMTEKDGRETRSRHTTGNEKLFIRRRPLYTKSCSTSNLPGLQEIGENDTKEDETCEIYHLTNHERRYSVSDEDLYKKTLLANCGSAGIRLPGLSNHMTTTSDHAGYQTKTTNVGVVGNTLYLRTEKEKHNAKSSPAFGALTNSEYCPVQRSRPRAKTVSSLESTRNIWKKILPERQRKHTKSANFLSTLPNSEVCLVERSRARSKTASDVDNPFTEHGRPRSKTESSRIHQGCQKRATRDCNWLTGSTCPTSVANGEQANRLESSRNRSHSSESVKLSEDESIAIKGKFRQIGHSVLAIALMRKMAKK